MNCVAVTLSRTTRTLAMAFFLVQSGLLLLLLLLCKSIQFARAIMCVCVCVWSLWRHGVCSRFVVSERCVRVSCLTRWMSNKRRLHQMSTNQFAIFAAIAFNSPQAYYVRFTQRTKWQIQIETDNERFHLHNATGICSMDSGSNWIFFSAILLANRIILF